VHRSLFGESRNVEAPGKRIAHQSMNQDERRSRTSAQIAQAPPFYHSEFFFHWNRGGRRYLGVATHDKLSANRQPIQAGNDSIRSDIASVASVCGGALVALPYFLRALRRSLRSS